MRAEMSNLDFTISCIVTFFSKKRTSLPNLNYGMYYPHIVIKGTEEYLGIKKATDPFPPEINFYVDADESDVNQRMVMINQRVVKEAYQGIVELSFLNVERFTGIAYSREAWNGFEAPLKKKFYDVDKVYHLVFRVYPFGKEFDLYFKLIRLDLSRRKAFTVKGVSVKVVNS